MSATVIVKSVGAIFFAALLAAQPEGLSVYQHAAGEIQHGQPGSAIVLLDPVLKEQPNDLRALTLMGMALTAAGRPADGSRRFRDALAIAPRYAPALRGLALNEMAAGDAKSAETHFADLL
jgi:Flp pilus assembly protein TadD